MKNKPITPYQRLLDEIREWASKVVYLRSVPMWNYPKEKLDLNWKLTDLWERIQAAEQLGYDVKLFATEKGIEVKYVQKIPERPFSFKY